MSMNDGLRNRDGNGGPRKPGGEMVRGGARIRIRIRMRRQDAGAPGEYTGRQGGAAGWGGRVAGAAQ